MTNYLYNMSMKYFNGVNFICWGGNAANRSTNIRRFTNYYGIQYNHSGPMTLYKEGFGTKTIDYSCAFITYPGPLFKYGPPEGKSRSHHFICFTGPKIQKYIDEGLLPINSKNPLLTIESPEEFLQKLKLINKYLSELPQGYTYAVNLLENLLLMINESGKNSHISSLEEHISALAEIMRKNPENVWDYQYEAQNLNISYTHFRRVFQQIFKMPPGRFLQSVRLNKAASLLRETDDSVGSIAKKVGIPDIFYFSKLFKRRFQLSPRTFREEFNSSTDF